MGVEQIEKTPEVEVEDATEIDIQKQQWTREMRKKLCVRPESYPETLNLIDEEGNLLKE